MEKTHVNIAIIGGGVAGLWFYRRLRDCGIQAVLIESLALGSGQTMASQGMIHGGQRYALQGKLTTHSEGIADMPAIWEASLQGTGEIDLSAASLRSDTQVMWSPASLGGKMAAFFASKSMRARVHAIGPGQYPPALADKQFNGVVYRMNECVVDMRSTITALVGDYADGIFKATPVEFHQNENGFESLLLQADDKQLTLSADYFVFTAALGNEQALSALNIDASKETQRRPLHQVMVKGALPELYGHCLAFDYEPRLTITTHQTTEGENVWYLGGRISTSTTGLSASQTIEKARLELKEVFPWIDWDNKQWATLLIDRAESNYEKGLAYGPVIKDHGNVLVCWPSKLTFAPGLSASLFNRLQADMKSEAIPELVFSRPHVADYPWDMTQWQTL